MDICFCSLSQVASPREEGDSWAFPTQTRKAQPVVKLSDGSEMLIEYKTFIQTNI